MNTTFNKKINDLEQEVLGTKDNEQHLLMNELKRENQELKDENQALRDKVANLSLKTSDMNTKIKDMDNERLSLITAIRLIQTAPSIDINTEERQQFQSQNEIKQNSKRNQTQRQSRTSESGEQNIQLSNRYEVLSSDDDEEQTGIKSNGKSDIKNRKGQDRQCNNRSNTQKTNAKSTKSPVAILGDSIVKMLQPAKLSRSADQKVQVKTFPYAGATITDMEHYVQPTLRTKPRMVVLHVGTNDIQHKEPKELADDMKSLCHGIVTKNPTCEIAISEIVKRQDLVLSTKIHETNKLLSNLCEESNWYFIKHSNIDTKHLNRSGLHLNGQGI